MQIFTIKKNIVIIITSIIISILVNPGWIGIFGGDFYVSREAGI